MKKSRNIFFGSFILVAIVATGFFIFSDQILAKLLIGGRPRSPKNEIETTFYIGWWAHQGGLDIENLEIEVIDSRLNLFNAKSLISYMISGTISGSKNWEPYVHKIHVSERFPKTDSTANVGLIELTPLIKVKENHNYVDDKIPFKITNEMIVESFHWGNNTVLFRCGKLEKRIVLKQRK
jgi:hypothetical protein